MPMGEETQKWWKSIVVEFYIQVRLFHRLYTSYCILARMYICIYMRVYVCVAGGPPWVYMYILPGVPLTSVCARKKRFKKIASAARDFFLTYTYIYTYVYIYVVYMHIYYIYIYICIYICICQKKIPRCARDLFKTLLPRTHRCKWNPRQYIHIHPRWAPGHTYIYTHIYTYIHPCKDAVTCI